MLKKLLLSLALLLITFTSTVFIPIQPTRAVSIDNDAVCKSGLSAEQKEVAGCANTKSKEEVVKIIVNTLLFAVGVASIIMIIVSGIQMILSKGNTGAVQKAKLTMIYAISGLLISLLAYAIVTFVLEKIQ